MAAFQFDGGEELLSEDHLGGPDGWWQLKCSATADYTMDLRCRS